MITVRFPNGQAVQYNDAYHVTEWNKFVHIQDKNKNTIAIVPVTCIIEYVRPCRVYNPLSTASNESLDVLTGEVQALRRKLNRMEVKCKVKA
jgi:hypothetical protein